MRDNWLWEVFESSPVAFNIQDEDGVLVMVNAAYCTLTGRPRADLLGRSPRVFTHPEDILKNILMLEHLAAAEVGDPPLRLEKRYVHPDGTVRWGWVSLSRAVGPEGQRWTMAVVHDTTDRRGAEEALHDAAHTDALTGLVNRRGWRAGLRRLLAAAEPPAPLTLVMLDMDNFKAYNDTHGHHAGDILLREFATKARGALRPTDLFARWGGEEFALALPHCPSANAATILADLAALVPHSQTFSAGHTTLRPTKASPTAGTAPTTCSTPPNAPDATAPSPTEPERQADRKPDFPVAYVCAIALSAPNAQPQPLGRGLGAFPHRFPNGTIALLAGEQHPRIDVHGAGRTGLGCCWRGEYCC